MMSPGTLLNLGLSEKNLSRIVDGEDCLAFGATKSTRFRRLEFFRTDRALEDLRKDIGCARLPLRSEKLDGFVEIVLYIEELREAQELKNFVDLWLNFEKHEIPTAWFNRLEKRRKRANTRARNIV